MVLHSFPLPMVALHTVAHYANYALAAAQTKAAYGMDQTKLVSASLSTRQHMDCPPT